jgi:PIN domain nuclease of toxin-antitoxin system
VADPLLLDASAFLAMAFEEPGVDRVAAALTAGPVAMSAVNIAEAVGIMGRRGLPAEDALADLLALGIDPIPFDAALAGRAAALEPLGRSIGLSLGDRACLATAAAAGLAVLTADRAWAALDLALDIRLVR